MDVQAKNAPPNGPRRLREGLVTPGMWPDHRYRLLGADPDEKARSVQTDITNTERSAIAERYLRSASFARYPH